MPDAGEICLEECAAKRWVPTATRLPEFKRYVLTQTEYGEHHVAKLVQSPNGPMWEIGNEGMSLYEDQVVAWAPILKASVS